MGVELPYLISPGTVDTGLQKIRTASEPASLNTANVGEVIGLKGGAGAAFVRLLKKLNFLGDTGKPTENYRKFRGEKGPSTALADGIRHAYGPFFQRNERADKLSKNELEVLATELTGAAADSRPVELIAATFLRLVKHADFGSNSVSGKQTVAPVETSNGEQIGLVLEKEIQMDGGKPTGPRTLTLSHNIHLNLPDTTDIRVFDAIFKSLKENLFR